MMTMRRARGVLAMAALLTGVWYLLSGMFDALHFGAGVATALVIAATYRPVEDCTVWKADRLVLYVPWLVWQIVVSNLRVARIVLTPRMPISPAFLRMTPSVEGPRALTLLGSSITLTPGTLTVDVDGREILVHALDAQSAQEVRDRIIERRVAEVFPLREEA
ncbi:MAG TPA: Na+/H+ antiporter subunit E [Vicinamibacterales bacterium]|nr:Na+/H+ antiporter subunit E [Vicinamibacterales bacterium]